MRCCDRREREDASGGAQGGTSGAPSPMVVDGEETSGSAARGPQSPASGELQAEEEGRGEKGGDKEDSQAACANPSPEMGQEKEEVQEQVEEQQEEEKESEEEEEAGEQEEERESEEEEEAGEQEEERESEEEEGEAGEQEEERESGEEEEAGEQEEERESEEKEEERESEEEEEEEEQDKEREEETPPQAPTALKQRPPAGRGSEGGHAAQGSSTAAQRRAREGSSEWTKVAGNMLEILRSARSEAKWVCGEPPNEVPGVMEVFPVAETVMQGASDEVAESILCEARAWRDTLRRDGYRLPVCSSQARTRAAKITPPALAGCKNMLSFWKEMFEPNSCRPGRGTTVFGFANFLSVLLEREGSPEMPRRKRPPSGEDGAGDPPQKLPHIDPLLLGTR